jgi:hypothetical protein
MSSATSQTPKNLTKLIGPAKRLLYLLVEYTPIDWTDEKPVYVSGSSTVTDVDLAELLDTSLETVARWRRTLRALGLIGWLSDGQKGNVFWVAAGTRAIAETLKYGVPKADRSKEAVSAREWVQ